MSSLTLQTLPAVHHVLFGIFNLAVPNIIFWAIVVVLFAASAWARLPKFIERSSKRDEEEASQ